MNALRLGVRGGARKQRVRQRLGLYVAGADRLRRLGYAKFMKLWHGCALPLIVLPPWFSTAVTAGECIGPSSRAASA